MYVFHILKTRRVLCNLDAQFIEGQHYALTGPSGVGKSSLLSVIANRVTPQKGTVSCQGAVATIYQDYRLVERKTALENVLYGSLGRVSLWQSVVRFPRNEIDEAISLLNRVGLNHRLHHKVSCLSGGEKQRVAIARALMQRPAVLLADEPVASLDEENAHAVMNLLTTLAAQDRLTVISVLHDSKLASHYCNSILRLGNGCLESAVVPESVKVTAEVLPFPGTPLPVATSTVTAPFPWRKTFLGGVSSRCSPGLYLGSRRLVHWGKYILELVIF